MIERPFWRNQITAAWSKRGIVWLAGVRRVGKTTLGKMLPEMIYCNCDLPSVQRTLVDPESFFDSLRPDSAVVFDEIHRIADPSRLLKIAADAYPQIKILATGSSTLAATRKFRDTLTGRKIQIVLFPVLWTECAENFGVSSLDQRMLHGGLPEALIAGSKDPSYYVEWLDSFFARDIQELFGVRNRSGFLTLLQLLLLQSGGLLDYTSLSKLSGLSRPTVIDYIESMRISQAVHLLYPFHGGSRREIVSRPKAYGFDTGFVTFVKGWDILREEDRGILWEHLVFDVLLAAVDHGRLFYWRDKSNREVDFIIRRNRNTADAIECKIDPDRFEPKNVLAFRAIYPHGKNWVVSPRVKQNFKRRFNGVVVEFIRLEAFPDFREMQGEK